MIDDLQYDALVAELRRLRESGLIGLRRTPVKALALAAARAGLCRPGTSVPAAVEALVRAAVERLDGGRLGTAAEYAFGLVPGTRDWPAQDRRRKGAAAYGVSCDRFRKHYERIIVQETAEAILGLCDAAAAPASAAPGSAAPWSAVAPARTSVDGGAQETAFAPAPRPKAGWEACAPVTVLAGSAGVPVTVHCCSVELLAGVDIVVSPQNTYFELPQTFKSSVSASLRRGAARCDEVGEILDDVVHRELSAWVAEHGRRGLAMAPGTVAPTSPGELADRGIRRLYHAAVTVPVAGSGRYEVTPQGISLAVRNTFRLARRERGGFAPPLCSIAFPLLGSGRGGLDPRLGLNAIWTAMRREIGPDDGWQAHFVNHRPDLTEMIVEFLGAAR
ncbi:hypothetical protein [Actinomadura fibrosa]|uniref:Macro domain-containing protein n=1 Tax=Actinomadura fibrosa TaxID=111802 RepID=A0ABW2XBC9_9ACTN|nr:hypothetical protein [Actinomadura fibrosa]